MRTASGGLDGDGLTGEDEFSWGTDPMNPDTDGDGVGDGQEVAGGWTPARLVAVTRAPTSPL